MAFFVGILPLLLFAQRVSSYMPNITTGWGTYQASLYDGSRDVRADSSRINIHGSLQGNHGRQMYTFTNVRFGKAPTAKLRFMASGYPDAVDNPAAVFPIESGARCNQGDCHQREVPTQRRC